MGVLMLLWFLIYEPILPIVKATEPLFYADGDANIHVEANKVFVGKVDLLGVMSEQSVLISTLESSQQDVLQVIQSAGLQRDEVIADQSTIIISIQSQSANQTSLIGSLQSRVDELAILASSQSTLIAEIVRYADFPKIYAIMHLRSVGGASTVFAFNGTSWTSSFSSLLTARWGFCAVVFNHLIHIIAGVNHESALTSVEVMDGRMWETAPPLETARHHAAAAVYLDKIYVIAGYDAGFVSSVESFDGSSWLSAPRIPTTRHALGAAVLHGKLYAIGGHDITTSGAVSTVEAFNGALWTTVSSMSTTRAGLAAIAFKEKIYAIGGGGITVESFNGSSWSFAPSMSTGTLPVVVFQDKIYAVGANVVGIFDGSAWSSGPSVHNTPSGTTAVVYPPEQ